MAINHQPKSETDWIEARYAPYVEKQLPCFYCNKPLYYPVVGWDGHGKDGKLLEIVMHPRCANALILRLAPDVAQADYSTAREE